MKIAQLCAPLACVLTACSPRSLPFAPGPRIVIGTVDVGGPPEAQALDAGAPLDAASLFDGSPLVDFADAAPASQHPSCAGLANSCGGNQDCCSSPDVPGGSYFRSYDLAGDVLSRSPSFPAVVSSFRLDKFEVTVGRFRRFVHGGMGTQAHPPSGGEGAHARIAGSGWDASWSAELLPDTNALVGALKCDDTFQSWTDDLGGNEDRPINCVSWFEAMAFCLWDGGYLPTTAEWNYAAAGGDQQRAFPWSSPAGSIAIDNLHASYFNGVDCVGDGMPDCAISDLVAVGSKPAGDGRWGQSDLAGNIAEWTLDWAGPYPADCTDCANLTFGLNREYRGGEFAIDPAHLRSGFRMFFAPSKRTPLNGVRCARP